MSTLFIFNMEDSKTDYLSRKAIKFIILDMIILNLYFTALPKNSQLFVKYTGILKRRQIVIIQV